jgi:F0F1-type ATP synthase assembly protein I
MGTGWGIASTLLAAILVCGGLGYLIDRLIGNGRVFLAIGMVAGAAVGTFLIYRTYGGGDGGDRA